jgi:hypothetical protein
LKRKRGSHASIFYPEAELELRDLRRFLENIGSEDICKDIFEKYMPIPAKGEEKNGY